MKRLLLICILLPGLSFSQENKVQDTSKKSQIIPVQSQYSNSFIIRDITFNKETDLHGKGEVLDVQFVLQNKTDDPMDLYIIVIASYEKKERTRSSFEMPIPEKDRIRSFAPYPFDLENYQYPVTDTKGNQVKDASGHAKVRFQKFPKDPKQGINPITGKMYHLNDRLVIRTQHLSKYRTNYFFFNEVMVLIFNNEGQPQYRQQFKLSGIRH